MDQQKLGPIKLRNTGAPPKIRRPSVGASPSRLMRRIAPDILFQTRGSMTVACFFVLVGLDPSPRVLN
jgi:hypothetical protein